jgi:hypothetical protein
LVYNISDEEFKQLKVVLGNVEGRKRLEPTRAQGVGSDEQNDNDNGEDSLTPKEVDKAIIAFVKSYGQKEQYGGPKQKEIVEEIKKNSDKMTGTARPTVLKRLKILVKDKFLVERPDSKNRQTKRYYFNEENLLLDIQVFFNNFENALISLVNAFLEKKGPSTSYVMSEEISGFFWFVFRLYQHVSNIVVTRLTLEWPKMTNDTVLLNKLSRVVFAKLIKLQGYLSRALYVVGDAPHDSFFSDSWMMTGEVISEGMIAARCFDLPKERVSPVLNLAWSISAPHVRCASTKLGLEVTDSNIGELTSEDGWMSLYIHWLKQQPKGPFIS